MQGEPARGKDCVELEKGLLKASACNSVAHVLIHWLENSKPSYDWNQRFPQKKDEL